MVYYLPDNTPPADWPAFWEWAEDAVETHIGSDLRTIHFETEEEALKKTFGEKGHFTHVFRFRQTDDRDNLLYFHEQGLQSLDAVEQALPLREWTPAFAHHWGVLMFCHGFLMSSAFAVANDLGSKRAGQASRERNNRGRHDRWFAHYYLREARPGRVRRYTAAAVERLVQAIVAGDLTDLGGFDREWFKLMLHEGSLTGRYRDQLSIPTMQRLVSEPTEDLPPLNFSIPHP